MSKGIKSFVIIFIIVLLVLGITWAVYENYKAEPASVNETRDLPNENKGIDNIINDFVENELVNIEETGEIETDNNSGNQNNTDSKEENDNNSSSSEVVEGTSTTREESAIKLAKEYYEEEYGNSENIYFRYDGVNTKGEYIVVASSNAVTVAFLIVDLDTGLVTEK